MDDLDKYTRYLGERVRVEMDRPMGSRHPRFNFTYETNYGFVPGTLAGDGHEIDAYVVGLSEPVASYEGVCIAVIVREDDDENKLVVADRTLPKDQIVRETDFVEHYYKTEYLYWNADGQAGT